jgi:hypothetical protein
MILQTVSKKSGDVYSSSGTMTAFRPIRCRWCGHAACSMPNDDHEISKELLCKNVPQIEYLANPGGESWLIDDDSVNCTQLTRGRSSSGFRCWQRSVFRCFCYRIIYTFARDILRGVPIPVSVWSKAWVGAAQFLGLWVRIPPGEWMSVSCESCVLSGLFVGLITRPEESY